jgi:Uma2 family endonuclease
MGMPASTESRKRWTADEARALTAANPLHTPRYEVIDGQLLVTPSPNRYHQAAVARLLITVGEYTRTQRIGYTLTSPFDVELAPDTTVQPDVFVLPPEEWAPEQDPSRARSLLLAVEVLSPSSARFDRTTKRRFFQRVGVPEYWVVDLDAHLVERWRPGDERPQIDERRLEWRPEGASEAFVLDLEPFFAEAHGEAPPPAT